MTALQCFIYSELHWTGIWVSSLTQALLKELLMFYIVSSGRMGNDQLYEKCFLGTKDLIEQYVDEVKPRTEG